ncbi:MAG: hypothetical protein HZC37_00680 [Burkholderiales bacterium]|nr:hypothetical protein [Burkholderiales bacterium]
MHPFTRVAAACLAISSAAFAAAALAQQSANDIASLKEHAGSYAVDCTRPDRTRLVVAPQAISVVHGKKRVDARKPLFAHSYWGRSPPPNAGGAMIGEPARKGAPGLTFTAWTDKRGVYLQVDADKPLQAVFGKPALAGKFRRCPAG